MAEPAARARLWAAMRLVLGLLISALAIWGICRQVEWDRVLVAARHARWWVLIAAVPMFPLRVAVIATRWRLLLGLYDDQVPHTDKPYPPPLAVLLRATGVGYLLNNVLPLRSGEVFRGGMAVRAGVPVGATASTLLLEKMLDVWALVALALVFGASYLGGIPVLAQSLRVVGILAAAALVGYVTLALVCGEERIAAWLGQHPSGLTGKLGRLVLPSCRLCHRRPVLAGTVLATAANWCLDASFVFIVARGCGLALSFGGALFLSSIVGLSFLIPSSPGGIGWAQYVAIQTLGAEHIEANAATAFALLGFVVGYLTVNGTGLVCLAWETLRRSKLTPAEQGG